jgi:hypothetical protein
MQNAEIRNGDPSAIVTSAFCIHHSAFPIAMNPVQHILIMMVRLYRWTLAPAKTVLFGPLCHCRFTPSCSEYALKALEAHGAVAGGWLAVKRICRCHPWGSCGHDAVPDRASRIPHPASRIMPKLSQ